MEQMSPEVFIEADLIEKTTIDNIPSEVLIRILQFLDSKNRNSAALVSPFWHTVVDEMIGRKLFIGRQCQFVPHDEQRYLHKYIDVYSISQVGVTECYVGEVIDPSRVMTLLTYLVAKIKTTFYGDKMPEFKYPHLVKSVHFDGPVPPQFFQSMVTNLGMLTTAEFHMTAFCTLQASNLQNIHWKRLKSLTLWGHRLTDGMFTTFYASQRIIPNVIILLSNNFPALTHFSIEYPFDVRDDKSFTQQILDFLKRHQEIQRFRICVNIAISADDGQDFETATDREWMREAKLASKCLQLKKLETIVSSMRNGRLAKLWMAFMEQQRALESATILSFRVPLPMLTVICTNNWSTLKKLVISRILMNANINGRIVQLDSSVFSRCIQLKFLTVEGMLSNYVEAGMVSTRQLSHAITHLDIGGLALLHQDVHDIFFELPNLQTVCFTDVGNQGLFGVTVETLREVIAARKIRIVTMYRSVCGQYPATGIPNGDPVSPVCVVLRPYDILEFRLNSSGYYENIHRSSLFENDDTDSDT